MDLPRGALGGILDYYVHILGYPEAVARDIGIAYDLLCNLTPEQRAQFRTLNWPSYRAIINYQPARFNFAKTKKRAEARKLREARDARRAERQASNARVAALLNSLNDFKNNYCH